MVVYNLVLKEIIQNTSTFTKPPNGTKDPKIPNVILCGYLKIQEKSEQQVIMTVYDCTGFAPAIFNIAPEDQEWKISIVNDLKKEMPYKILCTVLALPNESPGFMLNLINFNIDLEYYYLLGPVLVMECHNYQTSLDREMASLSVKTEEKENDQHCDKNGPELEFKDTCQKVIIETILSGRSSNVVGVKKETLFKNLSSKYDVKELEESFEKLLDQSHIFETIAGHYDTF